jgi:hypothetical protein
MKKLIALLILSLFASVAFAQYTEGCSESEQVFYVDPGPNALIGPVGGSWHNIGTAASASGKWIQNSTKVLKATWTVIWNPVSVAGLVGIRLVRLDYPPSGGITVTELARVQSSAYAGPTNSPVAYVQDITAAVQTLAPGSGSMMLQQGHGNGSNGWKLYLSMITYVWKCPTP